jgi:2-haloacid dehalogenase
MRSDLNKTRREFLTAAGASVVAGAMTGSLSAKTHPHFVVALFDAFVVFDPGPVRTLAERLVPGKGAELADEWRTRQFEYAWLRSVSGTYADFWHVTSDALSYAVDKTGATVSAEARDQLLDSFLHLKVWPDVPAAFSAMRQAKMRLGVLSNFSPMMLRANIESAGLASVLDYVISTDQARTYKPAPEAYRLGIDITKADRSQILFAAFAGWDAAGARLFGYPTFWVNRQKLPEERFGLPADQGSDSLSDLLAFVLV